MIPVTKPFSPPIGEYQKLLEGIWERSWFTNDGPLVQQLEQELRDYLNIPNLLYVSNGTIALQIAIKALGITKEIITTPFSYVATTSSIVWEGCTPVFVDIDPHTLNIDPTKIEKAITSETEAILATHCFGNPCDIDAIDSIAKKYNIKVIYDAAHCFGTKYKGKSVFSYGDVSTVSFHATKLYHTIEGGAVFASDPEVLRRMSYMRNFGHNGPEQFEGVGINGKNSEFHAAMGVINLTYVDEILNTRRRLVNVYDSLTHGLPLTRPVAYESSEPNSSYYPIIFRNEEALLRVKVNLENYKIFPRRYFYPSLNLLEYVNGSCPVSEDISSRIMCLPLYHDLSSFDQERIIVLIKEYLNS
jgi:dTDP-4-amino-4,6-dideoxygalactose transaminase